MPLRTTDVAHIPVRSTGYRCGLEGWVILVEQGARDTSNVTANLRASVIKRS